MAATELDKDTRELFTKQEEYLQKQLDKHGRFNYATSRHRSVLEPVVSQFLLKNGLKIIYPNSKSFAVCLTHDVDDIYPSLLDLGLSSLYSLKHLAWREVWRHMRWKWDKRELSPYRNFEQIMELEEKFGAKSTFYFLVSERDPHWFRYHIGELKDDLKHIIDRGWDIGLHIGYYSFDKIADIVSEKQRLEELIGREIIGCRIHYLRFKVPDTWEILAQAGFRYDTTLGYADNTGFRNGMCHPFYPFNLNSGKEVGIVEIPLAVMDDTLFRYMRLGFAEALDLVKKLVNYVAECHGVLVLLWHNDDFNCPFREEWAKLYKSILQYCREKNAWMTSAEGIYKWYYENKYAEKISARLK